MERTSKKIEEGRKEDRAFIPFKQLDGIILYTETGETMFFFFFPFFFFGPAKAMAEIFNIVNTEPFYRSSVSR